MRADLLINVSPFETRVALLEGGTAQEVHLQRLGASSVTGNIYQGKVERILPGMQAAFVNVGLGRPGFLHVRDLVQGDPAGAAPPSIDGLLREGQVLPVQVLKDPIATKGARLTGQLAIASRYLVCMPGDGHIGVSQKIEEDGERTRLRELVQRLRGEEVPDRNDGFIVRTAAEGTGEDALRADLRFLEVVRSRVFERAASAPAGSMIYEDLPVHIRTIRDLIRTAPESIRIDDPATWEKVRDFVLQFLPEYVDQVILDNDPVPMFDRFGVEAEIERALQPRVPLKCGGYLVIEQTEAMTTIDVNTGGYVGGRNLEETVFRANIEAAAVIPRQLRLRNLGGIIVIDFIDMEDPEHQRQVLRQLEKACESDPARTRVYGISGLGLVEMSRKRTRESLARQMTAECQACGGRGRHKSPETACFDIFRAIDRDHRRRGPVAPSGAEYMVRASQAVIDRMLDEDAAHVRALEQRVGAPIRFRVESDYGNDNHDVVLLQSITP